ncbi:MAG: hypothetical protein CL840_02800 [Crocinitomicaceae bacterium]|nr:hypothetical protein [Crocinitomicaceae bacterium]|tara:strand:+ start:56769 stop:57236 length:468 start_codon:yes stop_codon:yes gene_type:complete
MNFQNTLFAILLACTYSMLNAQTPDLSNESNLFESKNAQINGDDRIRKLEEKYIRINQSEQALDGYRIQLFSSSGPESWTRANNVQSEFLKIYPDIDVYVIHIKPSFRVRIGDYRTRLDAERFYIEIKENFPDAFIVRDRINFPVLNIEKEEEKD